MHPQLRRYMPIVKQFARYVCSGGFAAIMAYGSYLLLLWSGVYFVYANLGSEVVGFVTTFLSHKYLVFGNKSDFGKHFVRYSLLAGFNVLLGTGIIYALVTYLLIPEEWAKLVMMGLIVLWNFVVYRVFVFK